MTDAHSPVSTDVAETEAEGTGRGWATGVLTVLAVAWLAVTLWSANATLSGSTGVQAIIQAALTLPVVVTASLVAGAAVGLAAARPLGARVPRVAAALGGGLLVGLVVAALILAGYGTTSSLFVLAAGVAAAGLLGGAVSAALRPPVAGAAVAGTLAWLLLSVLISGNYNRLLRLFGGGQDLASQVNAVHWLGLLVAVVGGVVAGFVAYRYLRPRGEGLRWPAYLVAGAGPGLLLLLAGLDAAATGARLRSLAAASSEADQAALHWSSNVGLNTAMVVMFAGAITAMIAFGRTLQPEAAPAEAAPPTEAPPAEPEAGRGGSEAPEAGPGTPADRDQTS
ncbi:hypothetical protein [Planosporangium mesophilum]|uniref:Uncharacterized protein n=1 Tax=Planosporangium mesophilum TaxID=689768 RepID=A0A8J3TCX6_9ACTN|nr:hypothetical protein [Planosporangium mesophilum]NJC84948.1 hypothetical protein [Planosporangium mesophilum]GII23582.1 hypothetical protein Pme01_31790 [Planosporangium mesophilum]